MKIIEERFALFLCRTYVRFKWEMAAGFLCTHDSHKYVPQTYVRYMKISFLLIYYYWLLTALSFIMISSRANLFLFNRSILTFLKQLNLTNQCQLPPPTATPPPPPQHSRRSQCAIIQKLPSSSGRAKKSGAASAPQAPVKQTGYWKPISTGQRTHQTQPARLKPFRRFRLQYNTMMQWCNDVMMQ